MIGKMELYFREKALNPGLTIYNSLIKEAAATQVTSNNQDTEQAQAEATDAASPVEQQTVEDQQVASGNAAQSGAPAEIVPNVTFADTFNMLKDMVNNISIANRNNVDKGLNEDLTPYIDGLVAQCNLLGFGLQELFAANERDNATTGYNNEGDHEIDPEQTGGTTEAPAGEPVKEEKQASELIESLKIETPFDILNRLRAYKNAK